MFLLSTRHHQPLPRSNCETEGFSLSTHPSLARNARRRGCFFCRHTTNPSLARIARRRGFLCQHTPPSLETRDGGGISSVDTPPPTPPSLELRDGGVLCQHTPPSLETRDGGGVSSVDTPPPTPPSLELRDGGVLSVNTPLPRSKHHITTTTAPHCTWEDRSEVSAGMCGEWEWAVVPRPHWYVFSRLYFDTKYEYKHRIFVDGGRKNHLRWFFCPRPREHTRFGCVLSSAPLLHMPSMQTYLI